MKPVIKRTRTIPGYFPSFFDDMFSDFSMDSRGRIDVPAVNVKENDHSYTVELAVPGMSKDDFNIEVEDHVLVISAEAKHEKSEENERYTRKEFHYQSFKRRFNLPENGINEEGVEANYKDGVLSVVLPKMGEAEKPSAKRIAVK